MVDGIKIDTPQFNLAKNTIINKEQIPHNELHILLYYERYIQYQCSTVYPQF
jgi:hypothetical protein